MKLIQILMLSVKLCLNSFFNTRQCNYQNQRVKFIKVLGNITHMLSCVHLLATPWTKGHQAPLPIELSWQEYWSGSPFPTPGVLPYPGIAPMSPDWTHVSWVSCIGRQMFYHIVPPGKPQRWAQHIQHSTFCISCFIFCVSVLFLSLHKICTIT